MDNILTNKYFCLAIIIALGIMVYLYNARDSCSIEGMDNVDLSVLAPELIDSPWETEGEDYYRSVNSKFNKNADMVVKKRLNKDVQFLKNSDQTFQTYEALNKKNNKMQSSFPMPKDDHPELSQCQPCNCDNISTDSSDSTEEEYYKRKLYEIRQHKKSKR